MTDPVDPIVAAFARLLADAPGAVAVSTATASSPRAHVDAIASAVTARIERAGLAPGATVAFAAPNGPGFLGGLLGCLRARHPTMLVDEDVVRREGTGAIASLGAVAVVTCAAWPAPRPVATLRAIENAADLRAPAGATVLKTTSGSTGKPRAVAFSSAALLADARQLAHTMQIAPADRLVATIPMSFSYGLGNLTLPALLFGNEIVLGDGLNPIATLAAVRAARASVLPSVPVFLQAMLRLDVRDLPPTLRLVISAGAPLSAAVARAFRARFGRSIHCFYGSSETGGITYDRTGNAAERGTVGTPIEAVKVEVDADGAIEVRSPALGLQYLPDEGDATLREGRFKTADAGAIDATNGELRLLGRQSEIVNVAGRKVHPREVEAVIAQLAGVDDVVVVAEALVDRATDVCHAIVASAPGALAAREVREHCARLLAAHKVPKLITLVAAIPRTERGKLDRARLRALLP